MELRNWLDLLKCMFVLTKTGPLGIGPVKTTPTDLQNLNDRKSYDIFNVIRPRMISINLKSKELNEIQKLQNVIATSPAFYLPTTSLAGFIQKHRIQVRL